MTALTLDKDLFCKLLKLTGGSDSEDAVGVRRGPINKGPLSTSNVIMIWNPRRENDNATFVPKCILRKVYEVYEVE